jgi:hypothetical protein
MILILILLYSLHHHHEYSSLSAQVPLLLLLSLIVGSFFPVCDRCGGSAPETYSSDLIDQVTKELSISMRRK